MPHLKQRIKIISALMIAFFITKLFSHHFFLDNTPIIRKNAISLEKLINEGKIMIGYFLSKKDSSLSRRETGINFVLPSITPTVFESFGLVTVRFQPTPTSTPIPTYTPNPIPTLTPTFIIPNLETTTIVPTLIKATATPLPTKVFDPNSCPKSSNHSYGSITPQRNIDDMPLNSDPVNNPEINLRLRGFGPVNESTDLISRNGNNYGLDIKMPPQISTLFGGPIPQIIKTYIVYAWDFKNQKSLAPQSATPNFKVHLVGLDAQPGQKLYGLKAGRKINSKGDVFMVLYANEKDITFTHSASDTLMGGYLYFFIDICVDPNLLNKYKELNDLGRNQLPVVGPGQVFGYASNVDIKVGIRDTMSFMDPRYREDWWFYNQ